MLCSVTHDTTFSVRSSVLLHPGRRLAHIVVLEIGFDCKRFFFFFSVFLLSLGMAVGFTMDTVLGRVQVEEYWTNALIRTKKRIVG